MNELTTQARQLPDAIEDLSRFVLVGREKLNAVRAEIRAIEKVQLAAEVHEQKLQEAQEIAEAVLDAEAKLGELTSKMEKSVGGRPSETINTAVNSKKSQLEEIGLSQMQASRFETLANHPKVVEQAKADARAEGRIVTRSDVLNRIAPPKTATQSMREFKQQAREEHKEFKETPKDIVNLDEVKKDKKNLEIIALDISTTISRALASVDTIGYLKTEELKIMIERLQPRAKSDMISRAHNGIKVLSHLISNLEGGIK